MEENADPGTNKSTGQFFTTGPNISLGGIWVGWLFQEINMGGINPTVCRPNPRPTTLRFFCHINSSVPKTKFHVCEWDLGGMQD